MRSLRTVAFLLTLFGLLELRTHGFSYVDLQHLTVIVNSSNVVNFNLRVSKVNRATYAVSGIVEILDTAVDKYTVMTAQCTVSHVYTQF